MPRGTEPKREREYKELVERFEHEDRYKGREEEVAARIVNKQRAEYSEAKEERAEDREGQSPDRGLPIKGYDHLTIGQITAQLDKLSPGQVRQVEAYEQGHKNRKTLLHELDRDLKDD